MGCDIHLYVEVKKKRSFTDRLKFWVKPKWESFDNWVIEDDNYLTTNPRFYTGGRCYNLFAALCGVRSFLFEPEPPRISEPKGLPSDVSNEVLKVSNQWGTDGHSHSWNTLKELEDFNWSEYGETCNRFLDEVLPKMRKLSNNSENVRIVYFFDN